MPERFARSTRFGPADGIAVLGTGTALPADVDPKCPTLDTAEAVAALGAPPTPSAASWGVTTRQWVGRPGERPIVSVEELAAAAGARALADAGLAEVDLIHVATSTPSLISASLAARVALRLGLGCLSADVRGGGAGAILAWAEAVAMLRLGARTALVVAVEVMSPYLTPGDATGSLWGDGAGAIVLGPGAGGLDLVLSGTTKVLGTSFTVPGPLPPVAGGAYTFREPDRAYRDGLRDVRLGAARALREAAGSIDVALAYGATTAQVAELGDAIGAPVVSTLERTGCLGTAAIPVALDALRKAPEGAAGRRKVGAVAAGGGVVWGAIAWNLAAASPS
jgi:3-oxoacyl-[acyl-carrier-protein] synthase III